MSKKRSAANILSLMIILGLSACAGMPRSGPGETSGGKPPSGAVILEPEVSSESVGGGEIYGPAHPATEEEILVRLPEAAPRGEEPPQDPRLCLILGPGMAKALAQAAVLEAVKKAELPVHCVVGTEMGAVVGALYSQAKGSTNSLQWQLFKFNKENYFNFPLLSLREPKSTGRRLNGILRETFRNRRIEDLPIKFATVAAEAERGGPVPFVKGSLTDALSATLAMPEIFEPWEIRGEKFVSGAIASPAPLDLARSLGGNFLVLVDVIEDNAGAGSSDARFQKAFAPARNLIRLQKRDANFVIQVKAGAIPFDDFSRQGEILAAGSKAAERSVAELKAEWERWIAVEK